ncbi:MAG: hypothetical protein LBR83_05530, partial [Clostridiales bacterium]|nr:hypothetical protein [Clostridiales bacterium]
MLKKSTVCFALILFVSFLTACGKAASPTVTGAAPSTEIWSSEGRSACTWFNGDEPEYSMGINTDPMTIRVGKTSNGNDVFS